MNFKTILANYNINIPLSLIAITKGCDDSLSYFFTNKDSKSGLKITQNGVKLDII